MKIQHACILHTKGKVVIEKVVLLSLKYRNVAHFSESYLRSVSSKTTSDFEQSVNTQTQKFTEFEVSFREVITSRPSSMHMHK